MPGAKPFFKAPRLGMVYNEWGELVDPEVLKADPATREMDIKTLFRIINLNWHYRVSLSNIFKGFHKERYFFPRLPLFLSRRLKLRL